MNTRTVVLCFSVGLAIGTIPLFGQQFNNELKFKSTFETAGNLEAWAPRGPIGSQELLEIVKDNKHSGNSALKISNRQKTWHGAIHLLTDNAMPGDVYRITGWVFYKDGPANGAITMSIERSFKDEKAEHKYINLAAFQVKKGEWKEVSAEYTISADPTQKNIWVYFELPYKTDDMVTENDKIDFYIDDVVAEKLDPASKPKIQLDIPNLGDIYWDYFPIGAAVTGDEVDSTSPYAQLMMKHFTAIVAGNAQKMDAIQPKEGVFNWTEADKIVEFGSLTGMTVRWHTLQWHNQVPNWIFKDSKDPAKAVTKAVLNQRLKTHIQTIMKRYKGQVLSYDVVNEVLSDTSGLRTGTEGSPWYDILGPEYIDNAFKWAREADPSAQLVINDYNLESDPRKREEMYKLVKSLKDRKIPVDAVGMQMHISISQPSVQDIKDTIDRFASLGVKVLVTEMDVSIYENALEPKKTADAAVLLQQAQRYKDIFDVFKRAAADSRLDSVIVWGLSDAGSWLNNFPVPGRTNAPLLFDAKLQAKPAFWAIVDPKKITGLK